MRTIRTFLCLANCAVMAACATAPVGPTRQQLTVQRVEAVWAQENADIRAQSGRQTYKATPEQVRRAVDRALGRLEMTSTASTPSAVFATRLLAAPGLWTPQVRAIEEKRVRILAAEVAGPAEAAMALTGAAETVTAKIVIGQPTASGVVLDVGFASRTGETCRPSCVTSMPPTALRTLYSQFWTVFAAEIAAVQVEDRVRPPAKPAPSRPKKVPPKRGSGWVLPDSGWKPPPKP